MRSYIYAAIGVISILLALSLFYRPGMQYENVDAIIYHSPTCMCCEYYENYLKGFGLRVKSVEVSEAELASIKQRFGIPRELWSCHTVVIDGYYVEGHVPIEAINKMLEEKPDIKGISLPGMPAGSPGMSGIKTSLFEIYAFTDSSSYVFIKV